MTEVTVTVPPPVNLIVTDTGSTVTVLEVQGATVAVSEATRPSITVETAAVEVVVVNPGEPGPIGPVGPSVGVQVDFPEPRGSWLIAVPTAFGRRPNVGIYDLDGVVVHIEFYASASQVAVTFPVPFAGFAVLS